MRKGAKLFIVYLVVFVGPFSSFAQNKRDCLAWDYVVGGAQQANQSYKFSKLAFLVNSPALAAKSLDSAIFYIEGAIRSIDTALVLASDSELMGKDYANIAKKYAVNSYKLLKACRQTADANVKYSYGKQATFYSANAVTDAYHASFYFKNCKTGGDEKEVKEEKKDTAAAMAKKQVTKLDVDQKLFALLDGQLQQKTEEDKKTLAKLNEELKTLKDPAKIARTKEEIKKLEKEEAELEAKDKNAKEKLSAINTQIDERDKNGSTDAKPDETIFSKSMKRPADEWDKDVVMDGELPMGLVYQIQIGYYKNLIVSEVFRGLTPIMGKTVPGGGVSYSIGMFEKLADAQQAKNYVRSIGLTDAFVIAAYNGKKVSIAEAAKLEKK